MNTVNLWNPRRLIIMNGIFALAVASWFIPWTHSLWRVAETQLFYTLNGTLYDSAHAQAFWGTVNQRAEGQIMFYLVIALQLTAIFFYREGSKRSLASKVIFFWILMEIAIPTGNILAHKVLGIRRSSPSLVLEPSFMLSKLLHDPLIRDHSRLSFYSGHSFVNTYYALVALFCLPRLYKYLFVGIAVFMNMPRLFVGGHWLSDCIFAILIACLWMTWATATPLHDWGTRKARWLLDRLLTPFDRVAKPRLCMAA